MSKPKLFLRHKDDIIIELSRRQDKSFNDDSIEAQAINQGWVQALKWTLDFNSFYNTKEDNLLLEVLAKQNDEEFSKKIDELTNNGKVIFEPKGDE